jgi:hypothetical protein
MLGGGSIAEMFEGMSEEDIADMPPFPFPEKLFPPGTFPNGMKFSSEYNLPPQVSFKIQKGTAGMPDLSELSGNSGSIQRAHKERNIQGTFREHPRNATYI